jgi:hypothetical protein
MLLGTALLIHCSGVSDPSDPSAIDLQGSGSPDLGAIDADSMNPPVDLANALPDLANTPPDLASARPDLVCVPSLPSGHWSAVTVSVPDGGPTPSTQHIAVWGSAGNDVYITGSGCEAVHWDGANWTTLLGNNLIDVCRAAGGSSASDAYLAGSEVLHWDGLQWNNLASSFGGGVFQQVRIRGIASLGASDLWMVGESAPIHWDGSNWSSYSGVDQINDAVWMASSSDVWAVGEFSSAFHWDGSSWSSVSTGLPNAQSNALFAVWGSSPSDVWAVGSYGTVIHWNGAAWSSVTSNTSNTLVGLWGAAPNDVWAVGGNGTAIHYDGCQWSVISTGTTNWLSAIWGSSSNDLWAVGPNSTILHYGP